MSQVRTDYALSISHPKIFGEIDEEEEELICHGAYDLVLIENASEIFRQIMMDGINIEEVLEAIVTGVGSNCVSVRSVTFPLYLPSELAQDYVDDPNIFTPRRKRNFEALINSYRKDINKLRNSGITCIVGIIAVDLEEAGGHYGAFIFRGGDSVTVFDSMEVEGSSYYSIFFDYIVYRLFDIKPTSSGCIGKELSLQYTGGFSGHMPYHLEGSALTQEERNKIAIQSTESQNHFCYMWSIWYLHLTLLGYDLSSVARVIYSHRIDPLVIIKAYILDLTEFLGFSEKMGPFKTFFLKNFPAIWTNSPNHLSLKFRREEIESISAPPGNINDCFLRSIYPNVKLIHNPNTRVPDDIREKYC